MMAVTIDPRTEGVAFHDVDRAPVSTIRTI